MSSTLEPIAVATAIPKISGAVPHEVYNLLLSAGFQGRQLVALSVRLGLGVYGPSTLADAGSIAGMTRERVRQLERRLRDQAGATGAPLAELRRALRAAEQMAPASSTDVSASLAEAGLVPKGFRIGSLLRIADVLGLDHELCELHASVILESDLGRAERALKLARQVVRRDGIGNIARLARELGPRTSASTARRLLSVQPELTWLDGGRSWFQLSGTSTRAANLLSKMLSASGPLTFEEIRAGLSRATKPVLVSQLVVPTLCETYPWLVVDRARSTVTLKVALDVRTTHSPIELAIVRIFVDHGPVLTFSEVQALGERRGLNRQSVGVYLTRMPTLARVARGRYKLRGIDAVAA